MFFCIRHIKCSPKNQFCFQTNNADIRFAYRPLYLIANKGAMLTANQQGVGLITNRTSDFCSMGKRVLLSHQMRSAPAALTSHASRILSRLLAPTTNGLSGSLRPKSPPACKAGSLCWGKTDHAGRYTARRWSGYSAKHRPKSTRLAG